MSDKTMPVPSEEAIEAQRTRIRVLKAIVAMTAAAHRAHVEMKRAVEMKHATLEEALAFSVVAKMAAGSFHDAVDRALDAIGNRSGVDTAERMLTLVGGDA